MILSSEQINSYKKNGAIVIKDIFKPWINLLREGFEKVLKNTIFKKLCTYCIKLNFSRFIMIIYGITYR